MHDSENRHVRTRRRVATALAAAVACAATIAVAPARGAVPVPTPVRSVGFPGHAGLYGWGAATMADGSVLIGDYWNYRIQHFAKDGSLIGTFLANRGYGPGQHQVIYGLAVDPVDGAVYVADNDRERIHKYTASGQWLYTFGSIGSGPNLFKYPSRIAVAPDRRVFVADMWEHVISVHDPADGHELFQFGSPGTGDGQFQYPRGMAFDSQGRLHVVDGNNNRIEVFDQSGTFLFKYGSKGGAPGQFAGDMRGLAIDKAHDWLYVVDAYGNRIHKFDVSGPGATFMTRWGSAGTGDGQFSDGGREITVDGDGNVWVGDMPNWRAQKFSPTGRYLLSVPDPVAPPAPGGFNGAEGVAVDANGNIFVADTYNQRIEKLAPDGSFVTQWGSRGEHAYGFNYPRGIAVDPTDQSVLVADPDNYMIKKYDNNGVFQWEVGGPGTGMGKFKGPQGLDVAADGRVFVADSRNSRVQVLAPDGAPLYTFGTAGSANGQFRYPRGVAMDPDGSVWVADSVRNVVQHFSATGTYLGKLGNTGTGDAVLDNPYDLEVDSTYVYVNDTAVDKAKIYTRSGTFVTAFGGTGTAAGRLNRPTGMDLYNGRLYIVEKENDRIQEFALDGSGGGDTTPPDATVTSPAPNETFNGSPIVFSGTATDDTAVAAVKVAIQDTATSSWWNANGTWGAYQQQSATLAAPGATSTAWSYAWPVASNGSYAVQVEAQDTSANKDATKPFVAFAYFASGGDTTPPDATVTVPTDNQAFPQGPITFTGGATDNVAVASVKIAIQRKSDKLWWRANNTWGSYQLQTATLASPGGAASSWSYTWTPPAGAASYGLQVATTDTSSNPDPTKPWVNFRVTS